jgi:tetratricopeptide (TPR) repeat protein
MSLSSKAFTACLAFPLFFAPFHAARAEDKEARNNSSLQQNYNRAQQLQGLGKLDEAAEEYRAFLAEALGQLAIGYSVAGNYKEAALLFDEALRLEPGSQALLLADARTLLMLGESARSAQLAAEFIKKYPDSREQLAQAHQLLGRTLLKQNRDRDARKELETAVALDPTFPNGYDLAVACLDLDDESCAVKVFGEMEKSFGDEAEIHLAFGRAYADSDFQPRAVTELKRAIEENPQLPGEHYLLAAVLLATSGDESHVGAAEEELKKELAVSPRDPSAYAALGKMAVTRGNYPEAEIYLKKAVSLDSRSPDPYLYLGQMYVDLGRSAEAENALRDCIRLTTDVSRNRYQVQKAHFLLGRILLQQGKQEAAHAEMDIARDLNTKILSLDRSKLAGLMDTAPRPNGQVPNNKDLAAAESGTSPVDSEALHKAEALKEQLKLPVADSYNNLGAIAATKADYSKAVTYFQRSSMWNPTLDGLDYNWGRAAFAGSQYGEAVLPLSRYVKAHPEDRGGRSVLAISHFMVGNYSACIEDLQPLIDKVDLDPQVDYCYAESMVRTGHVADGAARLQSIEKLHPEIADVHLSLGEALSQLGDKQGAIQEFRAAIQLRPRDADAHYALGKIALDSRETATAISELEAAARLSPENERFHQELSEAYMAAFRPADAEKEKETFNLLRSRAQGGGVSAPHAAPLQQ